MPSMQYEPLAAAYGLESGTDQHNASAKEKEARRGAMSAPLLLQGTALHLPLRDASVQCIVTSPPYFGLRDYGTATWVGGNAACAHRRVGTSADRPRSGLQGGLATVNHAQEPQWLTACGVCGATRVDAQIGVEGTLESYLATLVQVFKEVWRVLHPSGVLFLNIGDSYNAAGRTTHGTRIGEKQGTNRASATGQDACRPSVATLKEKDLCMVPARLALALQQDGWTLRSAITWCKTAPFPESVKDRPTRATEMLYLLTKQPTYFYNADAVRVYGGSGWHGSSFTSDYDEVTRRGLGRQPRQERPGHNLWDYWVLGPAPVANGHYASFPPALVERCILAGSRPGDCVFDPFCGSGTTMLVARGLGRASVGLDLSRPYLRLAQERLGCTYDHLPLFQEVP